MFVSGHAFRRAECGWHYEAAFAAAMTRTSGRSRSSESDGDGIAADALIRIFFCSIPGLSP
jgi:hypothetical protein